MTVYINDAPLTPHKGIKKMPDMTDPREGLKFLQMVFDKGMLEFEQCKIYPELHEHHINDPNDAPRFTYIILKDKVVESVVFFVMVKFIERIPCFQMGWATIEAMRGKGLATNLIIKGIAEFKTRMNKNRVNKYYLEAVIPQSNTASQKLAAKVFSESPKSVVDCFSGINTLQYLSVIE